MLVGLAYIFIGGYLLTHLLLGVASLTLLLASLFLIEGALDIVLYFRTRQAHGSSWLLFDGVVTLLLALLIGIQWPSSSAWAIGTLVGVSLIMSGVARIMMSVAARRLTPAATLPKAALRSCFVQGWKSRRVHTFVPGGEAKAARALLWSAFRPAQLLHRPD